MSEPNLISDRLLADPTTLQRICSEASVGLPFIAAALASLDYEQRKLDISRATDVHTQHAARKLAKDNAAAAAELRGKLQVAENRIAFYEQLFPWLADYSGCNLMDLVDELRSRGAESPAEPELDPAYRWVDRDEWRLLAHSDRVQRALDNWRRSRRATPWLAGRDYERCVGWELEQSGYRVVYVGARSGIEDHGRDLVATRGEETLVVQCKFWRSEKTIHEKHIYILFGTTAQYAAQLLGSQTEFDFGHTRGLFERANCYPLLVTSATVSAFAKQCADLLGVRIHEQRPLSRDYPILKCNVAHESGERIYHLPFDQQYDRTDVDVSRGEFYAATIAEAELAGFRRAWRFGGNLR